MGKVYLVGAGCGSLDLYTLKAMECIKKADCLVYDHLVDDRIIQSCKDTCEMIYVGKKASHHTMKQEDICSLLVEKSKQHNITVRLKGGDVYVFGRGGEEGEVLYKNHVDFEVVPGLSSVTAGLAYAGIPITHRGLSGGFQVYTGQLRQGEERKFDFSLMLDDYCTYVFLMSMAKLDMIVEGFLNAGKRKDTGVAVVSRASLPNQKTLVSTLENIREDFKNNPLENPGIIVVGDVVSMREYLNFYETKPLFSSRILVTSVGHDHYLRERLEDLGAHVDEVVTGEVAYIDCDIPVLKGCLVFTSKHGVIGFMKAFKKRYKDLRVLKDVRIICIGQKTNEVLNEYGLNADFIPSGADSDILNQELYEYVNDDTIYLVKGNHQPSLKKYDQEFVVYENRKVEILNKCVHYDYGLFTCASSVRRFKESNDSLCDVYISIGAHTTKAIQECYGNVKIKETSLALKEEMIKQVLEG